MAALETGATGGAVPTSRYRLLLVTLLLLLEVAPFSERADDVVFVAVLWSGLRALGLRRRMLLPAIALALLTFLPRRFDPGGVAAQAAILLFMGLVAAVVLRQVVRQRVITLDLLYGAACVYLFLGLCWGKAYLITERLYPGSFALGSQAETVVPPFPKPEKSALLMYLSFITLTTTGYGDVTPVSPPARALTALEAIVGQLFLTITIARLVGLYTATAAPPSRAEPTESTDKGEGTRQ